VNPYPVYRSMDPDWFHLHIGTPAWFKGSEILTLGYTDHVFPIAEAYGDRVFINVHIPSAICEIFDPHTEYVGFEQGLLAFHDQLEGMGYLIQRCYEEQLQWARAFASAGAHGFCMSESYISPDIAGPQLYRGCLKPMHREYFGEIARLGLTPLCNFWGDVNPLIDDLAEIEGEDRHSIQEREAGQGPGHSLTPGTHQGVRQTLCCFFSSIMLR